MQSKFLLFTLLSGFLLAGSIARADDLRVNLILIVRHEHPPRLSGKAEHPRIRIPSLDRLRRRGAVFHHTPATKGEDFVDEAFLLSGRCRGSNGRPDGGLLPRAARNIPQLLRGAGYRTAFLGHWPSGGGNVEWRNSFHQWVATLDDSYEHPSFLVDGVPRRIMGYLPDILTRKAIHFLRASRFDYQPFFLVLSHRADAGQYLSAARHRHLYRDVPVCERHREYARYLTAVDESVGAIFTELSRLRIIRETVILYVGEDRSKLCQRADHPATQLPLLVFAPKLMSQGSCSDHPVLALDVAPTLLEAAGLEVPPQMYGRSLLTVLEQSDAE
jgi:arylsulfatase A-like enzyme